MNEKTKQDKEKQVKLTTQEKVVLAKERLFANHKIKEVEDRKVEVLIEVLIRNNIEKDMCINTLVKNQAKSLKLQQQIQTYMKKADGDILRKRQEELGEGSVIKLADYMDQ